MQKVLVKSKTCRKCKEVEKYLNENPVNELKILNASEDDGREFAIEYKVKAAPTLLILDENNEEIKRFVSDGEIIAYFKGELE